MTAEDVRLWRFEHGLTQLQLADLLGVTVLAVKHWENGRRQAPWYLRLALERLDQLLTPSEVPA